MIAKHPLFNDYLSPGQNEIHLDFVFKRLYSIYPNLEIFRAAQELLCSLTLNCNTHSQLDVDIIVQLTKMRLKTKPNIQLFLHCLRDLVTAHPENLSTLLKNTIFNELSNARNTNNMQVISLSYLSVLDRHYVLSDAGCDVLRRS